MKRFAITFLVAVGCGGEAPVQPPVVPPLTSALPAEVASAPKPLEEPPTPLRVTEDAPFRANAPAPLGAVTFVPPEPTLRKLKNGVPVYFALESGTGIVSVRVVSRLGAGDVRAKPGVALFSMSMLEQGAGARDALALSDAYEAIGAQHGTWAEWDSAGAWVKILSEHFDRALELLSDVVLRPTMADAEIERMRERRLAAIAAEKDSLGAMANNALVAALYGRKHPYGYSLMGREGDVRTLARHDVVAAYESMLQSSESALVVTGDVEQPRALLALEKAFGSWKSKGAALRAANRVTPKVHGRKAVVVDKPGATQSVVLVVGVGPSASVRERDALGLLNSITGGSFSSRINMNLREKHAYTYGARSRFNMRHAQGPFTVGGNMVADKTGAAIQEIFAELDALKQTSVGDDELADSKEQALRALPARFETVLDKGSSMAELFVYGLRPDEYKKRPGRIEHVTAKDILKAASWLPSRDALVVIAGDMSKVAPQLKEIGLAEIEERDASGEPK